MSEEINGSLNTDSGSPSDETLNDAGATSAPIESEDGLVSTTEFAEVSKPDDSQYPGTEGEGGDPSDKETEKGPVPYDRFQEVVHQNQELKEFQTKFSDAEKQIAMLQGKLDAMTPADDSQKPDNSKINFVPMQGKSDDDLRDWFETKPLEFISNLAAQLEHEIGGKYQKMFTDELAKRDQSRTYEDSLNTFAKKHEDFSPLKDSGKLDDYVERNPGHTIFSAYHELTAADREVQHKEAIAKAVEDALKKEREKTQANIKAKHELRTISTGTTRTPTSPEKELENTAAGGGLISTLSARLAQRRAAKAG